jgi:hypothetical protein
MTRKLSMLAIVSVLAITGAYTLIYLFRWQWNRAIITGIFFLAAELALAIVLLLRRFTRLEHRLDRIEAPHQPRAEVDPVVLDRLRESAPPARRPFEWLDPRRSSQHTNVFLPFLLGIGAVASALAWVVEHVARRTASPLLEQRLGQALLPISLPAGGLVGSTPAPMVETPRISWRKWMIGLGVALAVAVPAAGAIDWLADSIQTRPDKLREDVYTTVEVQLSGAVSYDRPELAATALWGTCSQVISSGHKALVNQLGHGRVSIVLPNDLGAHQEARVRGCIEDAVVDEVQASVVSIERAHS